VLDDCHQIFKHSTKYSTESASAFTNSEETTDSIISKNAFKFILPCLRPLECNETNQISFLMKGEKIVFKVNNKSEFSVSVRADATFSE
jgi:hypothetical protein